jgi:acetyl-CoA carboxylase biotin carboxyl carrier protein
MKFTNEDVQEILQLLDAAKYDELYLETARFKLTLRRNRESGEWSQETQVVAAPKILRSPPAADSAPEAASAVASAESADARKASWTEVRAHLPGTFYRVPKPGAPPYIEVGSSVEENTVVGIIETMKLMNAVHAQASGEIAEICFENAQFVEKDAVLMRIRPEAE